MMPESVLNEVSHRRFNPLRGSWLLVSPHRMKRPWLGQQEEPAISDLPDYDPKCYLCPGNSRAAGDKNPNYTSTTMFVNDYSAVKDEQEPYSQDESSTDGSADFLRAESVTGVCYVVTFSPRHNLTLADLKQEQLVHIVQVWTQLYASLIHDDSILRDVWRAEKISRSSEMIDSLPARKAKPTYMQIFENKGAMMGCSNPHPHGQVWTTTGLPEEMSLELYNLQKYRKEHDGEHLLQNYAKLEIDKKERVVFENAAFVAVCPWWATWPFEVMIICKTHARALVDLDDSQMELLAEAIGSVCRRYDNLFQTYFPYSMGIHQAPLQGTADEIEASYLHLHFYPPLLRSATVKKFLVGYELMAEPQRDITPEQAAKRLRDCTDTLYRTKA